MQTDVRAQSVKFITLGCKVNQYESQGMRESVLAQGFSEAASEDKDCDFVVINTCTVTADADKMNRYWIRRMRRENPAAKIVVTGCYVERNRSEIEALEEVDLVLSNHEKPDLAGHLSAGCSVPAVQDAETVRRRKLEFPPLQISRFEGNGRAFVKIQDGCNHACSFCKVVMVRGRSRSREIQEVVDEAGRLASAGYREVVFAGIQLGAYGLDKGRSDALSELLEACAAVPGLERLRLSSIEPTDVRPRLIQTLRDIPKCCAHLHIPLQSGDDAVLKAMNRRHGRQFYRDLVAQLKQEIRDFELSFDVMAGFPGETAEAFENTVRLVREVRPLKSHVFPYSPREGTRAAHFPEAVEPAVIRSRVQELIRLGDEIGRQERLKYVRRIFPVLVEKKLPRGGLVQGLTHHYLKVCFQGSDQDVGQMIPVELLSLEGDVFLGRPAGRPGISQ
ncbi:MAG: tRNA (N(6)-L-threonylcarbamoyladenosine(37)-C(2))-methylthiotransferase MtaB [Candidatus Omnitrophica bacterium]|nr:tRNA (N(6)-L-threonylcarbamoyladenosine(37)-C(2))-methylthiotransferase MtaB [Candidatus Omnitrophota bacterium]